MKILKMIIYILTILCTASCQYKSSPTVSLKVEQDSVGTGVVDLLKIEITNTSSKKVYLTDFHLTNYLKVYNSKGEDFTLKYLENASFENLEDFSCRMINNQNDSNYIRFKSNAVKSDYERIKRLNFFLKIDKVKYNSLNRAIASKYENVLLIESGETIPICHSINSLKKYKGEYTILFKYPDEHIPAFFPGLMHCYERLDGKNEKYFIILIMRGIKEIDGYQLFKKKIQSDPLIVSY